MANAPENPFTKSEQKNSLLTVTLVPEQRRIVEALRDHLGLKTNAAVALAGLAALYDKNRRQLEAAASATDEGGE